MNDLVWVEDCSLSPLLAGNYISFFFLESVTQVDFMWPFVLFVQSFGGGYGCLTILLVWVLPLGGFSSC